MIYFLSVTCAIIIYRKRIAVTMGKAFFLINFSLCSGYAANLSSGYKRTQAVGRYYLFNNSLIALLSFISGFLSSMSSEECPTDKQ